MDKILLEKFVFEIEKQCRFCLIAYEDLNQALKHKNTDRIWYSVQAFLVASANISKLFGLNSKNQKLELVKMLEVDSSSPLGDRDARDYFEHFYERLERWFNSSLRHNFVDSNIGSTLMFGGIDKHDFIRSFDPEKMAITFYGEEHYLIPVVEAIQQLREKIKIEAEKNKWYVITNAQEIRYTI